MGSQIEYVDSTQIYATRYVRNSKAIGALWMIFTICYTIISIMAFVTPDWLGKLDGEVPGKFGPWSNCYASEIGEQCNGKLYEFYKIADISFLAATVCVFVACMTALASICAMLWFFFCQSTSVYYTCGWLQLISGEFWRFQWSNSTVTSN